jgi:hypothetical protein
MKLNYTLASVLCLLLSVPLAYGLLQRRSAGDQRPAVRFATCHAGFPRGSAAGLLADLEGGKSAAAQHLAAISQRLGVEVLLLSGIQTADASRIAAVLVEQYFAVGQAGEAPLALAHGLALENRDAAADGSCMLLLSRWPIQSEAVRSFQQLPWSRMPQALRPQLCAEAAWAEMRLSSRGHWDVPIRLGAGPEAPVVHLLCSHPVAPGSPDRGDEPVCRNHDEIRFWVDYLTPERSGWIADDAGGAGGLSAAASFVVLGTLHCDPADGDGRKEAIAELLSHPRIRDPRPGSAGAIEQHQLQWGSNARHRGDSALDTADLDDRLEVGPGNLRLDYVLPARGLSVQRSGVFWPPARDPAAAWIAHAAHRMVWVDVVIP